MAFTQDGQIDPALVAARDKDESCDAHALAQARKHLQPAPGVPSKEADQCWNRGKAMQCKLEEVDFKPGPQTSYKSFSQSL